MGVTLVVGTQWGDEGKGKMVDILALEADLVLRFGGGANAGHTIVADGETFKFHLLPSGVIRPGKTVALGNGMVIDPGLLIKELGALKDRNIPGDNVFISNRAHVILPYHKVMDSLEEAHRSHRAGEGSAIGTTRRGIGPAYTGKVRRTGIRMGDMASAGEDRLRSRLEMDAIYFRGLFEHLSRDLPPDMGPSREEMDDSLDVEALLGLCAEYREELAGRVRDVAAMAADVRAGGGDILLEGAQGTMLDVDHGSYPFVTSSNCTAGGACTGSGIGPRHIDRIYGVVKAYTTRVGAGPMVTELDDEVGEVMREKGREYGTTTSRPRRCGWLDMVVVDRAASLNSLDGLMITKIDVLDELDPVKVCTAYKLDGQVLEEYPEDFMSLADCEPVYKTFPGWSAEEVMENLGDDGNMSLPYEYAELPPGLRDYVQFIADHSGTPVVFVSVGPARHETFDLRGNPVKPRK